ncbi:unnamed protein product [Strongylus vulgaris]|uniref:Uncharacterized protein n=1 Tax=Strongylus vulgaris TaxID=40348 RepID=A0A3P7HYZ5_STRVU|nr:unnamed protein product [Strongylus vulgaris]
MPDTLPASDNPWLVFLGQGMNQTNQHQGGNSELDATQSSSTQNVNGSQAEVPQQVSTTKQNGEAAKDTSSLDTPSTSKSLFGASHTSRSPTLLTTATDSTTSGEATISPDTPTSSKEAVMRSPADEEIRQRRLRRFGDAGSSSEDH